MTGLFINSASFAQVQHQLWGITSKGGPNDDGVIFKTDASGNNEMIKQSFTPGGPNSTDAYGSLMRGSDGNLYGMTWYGGSDGSGNIFLFDPRTSGFSSKHDFTDMPNGRWPQGNSLIEVGGMYYGMTNQGGISDNGVLFQLDPATGTYTKKADFSETSNGGFPYGSLILATDGMLYGMTSLGGINDDGVIFQYNPATSSLTKKFDFDGTNHGSSPYGSLVQATDGMLYGMTKYGGTNGYGVIFKFNPVNSSVTKLLDFDMSGNGGNPDGSLIQATDGKLYGMTEAGGANSMGVLFQFSPVNSNFVDKVDFDGSNNGSTPLGGLIQATDGMLYGLTSTGGTSDVGVMFQYNPATSAFVKKTDFAGLNGSNPEYTTLIEIPVTISTSAVSLTNCVGSTVSIPYTIQGAYDDGNVFTAQLSDATGSFANPVVIGSISSTNAGTITAVIPASTAPGTAYRIRVVGSIPVVTGSDNGANLSINALPDKTTTLNSPVITANLAGAGYQWLNCGTGYSIISGQTSQSFTPTANGSYAVIVTVNENGCSDTSSCVTVTHIGIDELATKNQFTVYPNPSSGVATIIIPEKTTIDIINIEGQVIKTINNFEGRVKVDVENLSKGVYLIKATNDKEIQTKTFIKE